MPVAELQHDVQVLWSGLADCMLIDQARLRRRLHKLRSVPAGAKRNALYAELSDAIGASQNRRSQRLAALPRPQFPQDLPVVARRDEIRDTILAHQVVILCGETGSGKTTQLPKICLELGRGVAGLIGHTQPRRIAARSVAQRIAKELQCELGHAVGYKVRFSDKVSPNSFVKMMTDGVLLAETQSDPYLHAYDTVIIDEAHERSLNIDFLLGYLKRLLPKRPDLKLIITSATIDTERFSKHFDNAPVLAVQGRSYPVEVRYRPLLGADGTDRDRDVNQAILDAVDELAREGLGDMLVFLPGEREIRAASEALRKHHPPHTEILPLFSRLSVAEQNKLFQTHIGRRVVLATNVAETSLTVPGIRYVIDTGVARIKRVGRRSKIQRLPIEPISQSSANQRAGRCGRLGPGICIRLYSEEDFNNRPPFTEPEILRTSLAGAILQMQVLGLGDVAEFPFLDCPNSRQISDSYKLLEELGAVDRKRKLTSLGGQLAKFPTDPRVGRMILAGRNQATLTEVLIIASALSIQDPRERPFESQQAADEAHRRFQDERSDFLSYLKLWNEFETQVRHLSQNKLRKFCKEHFLSYTRMQEWRDVHSQLLSQIKDMGWTLNSEPAEYAEIHRALLTGLLTQIGFSTEPGSYTGTHNAKFQVFPGSALYKKQPKWIMAGELVETSKPYARIVAKIDPTWIEVLAGHLLNRSYFEPHWEKKSARVAAYERISLGGLILVQKRRVNYGPIDPVEARQIFLRTGLVEGNYDTKAPFYKHNLALVAEVQDLEHRSRRHDILVSDDELYQFYDERIPAGIVCGADFEKWRMANEAKDPQCLYASKALLMRHEAREVSVERYPNTLRMGTAEFPLSYQFAPGTPDDGVTLSVPISTLNQIDESLLDWLVPGLLEEKILVLIRALPKSLRRNFVPVPDYARACCEALAQPSGRLLDALAAELQRMSGLAISGANWAEIQLAEHLRMNIRVIDDDGKVLDQGRDLISLQRRWGRKAALSFRSLTDSTQEHTAMTDWTCGNLEETVELLQAGVSIRGYPALVDMGTNVSLHIVDDRAKALRLHQQGLIRLYLLRMHEQVKYLRKHLSVLRDLTLHYTVLPRDSLAPKHDEVPPVEAMLEELMTGAIVRVFLQDSQAIRDREQFERRLDQSRSAFVAAVEEMGSQTLALLKTHQTLSKRLSQGGYGIASASLIDMREQLSCLVYRGFIRQTPVAWWPRLPKYLQAMALRLDRAAKDPARDVSRLNQIAPLCKQAWKRLRSEHELGRHNGELQNYRWLLEEYRLSLFAQELKTLQPISETRLAKLWQTIKD